MKIIIFLSSLLLIPNIYALSIKEIKSCGEYYYGSGISEVYQEASDIALEELTSQISVRVSSSFVSKIKQSDKKLEQSVESILNTYSTATLKNVQTIKKPVENGIEIFHYIKKTEVNKIFDERKKLIYEIYTKSNEMEKANNIGYALKWYYFAAVLMNSLPDQLVNYKETDLTTEIPHRINTILLNTDLVFKDAHLHSGKEKIVTLRISYNDKPVSYLEFSFWDGNNQINVVGKDGFASLHLLGGSIDFDELDVYIKYSFYECRDEFKAVGELWDLVTKTNFKNKKKLPLIAPKESTLISSKEESSADTISKKEKKSFLVAEENDLHLTLNNKEECPVADQILAETISFLSLFKNAIETNVIENTYSEDKFLNEKLQCIVHYNQPLLSEYKIKADINKTVIGWEVRKIGVMTQYPSIHRQDFEYVILDFSNEGYLQDINFGIIDGLYQQFVEQAAFGNDWGNRQVIIKFVEKYRTAYLNRDLSTIESIFSDDAVIIVGRIRTTKNEKMNDVGYSRLSEKQPDVEYLRFTKQEYLKWQKRLFNINEDIFLGFASFKITRKNNMPGVYGVEMRQHYNSSIYSDEGHLFLLIDFNVTLPQIYVRAWQPQEWDETKLVTAANFFIHR